MKGLSPTQSCMRIDGFLNLSEGIEQTPGVATGKSAVTTFPAWTPVFSRGVWEELYDIQTVKPYTINDVPEHLRDQEKTLKGHIPVGPVFCSERCTIAELVAFSPSAFDPPGPRGLTNSPSTRLARFTFTERLLHQD